MSAKEYLAAVEAGERLVGRLNAARAEAQERLARECQMAEDRGYRPWNNKEHQMATVPENVQAEKVAARLFGDEALKHCQFDTEAAIAIASIVHMVLKANRHRLGMTQQSRGAGAAPSRPSGEQPVVGKA